MKRITISAENATPFILTSSSGLPQDYYRQSDGRLFSIFMGADRAMKNFVAELPGRYCTLKVGKGKGQYSDRSEVTDILPPRQGVTNPLPGICPAPDASAAQAGRL